MAQPLQFHRANVKHPTGREREAGEVSRAYLLLSTPSGQAREVPVTEDELIRLMLSAAETLVTLRGLSR